jgi:hypothetical protein
VVTRFTWGIVIGVLVLVAVSVGLAIALPRTQPTPDISTPDGVVLAYGLAMQRGEPEAAWDLLSSGAQAPTTRDRFVTRASGLTGAYERARLSVEDVHVEGTTARVDLVRTYARSGGPFGLGGGASSTTNVVRLVRENGNWRISTPPDAFVLDPGRP